MTSLSHTDLLGRLVAFDSVSRNSNLPIANFICEYVDVPGVRIHRNASPNGEKVNVVAAVGPEGDPSRGLVLSGHMDTVPADEPDWSSDPFVMVERDGDLVGRGAADMKAFLAIAMNRFRDAAAGHLQAPLALLFTRDEEWGTIGARHFVESYDGPPLPRRVIVGEPTELACVTMHKGFLELRITLTGVPAHSGYPHLGRSAIEPAGTVNTALATLRRTLDDERPAFSERFPDVPFAALNVGRVHGGAAVNVVPDRCTVEVGIRLLPTMETGAMVERVRTHLDQALGETPYDLKVLSESPPMWLDRPLRLVDDLLELTDQPHPRTVSYATDAGWLQTAGHDCVIFGPGSIDVAHKPNEYVPRRDIERADTVLAEVVHRHCFEP